MPNSSHEIGDIINKANDLPVSWIDSDDSLELILKEIQDLQRLALDTEFIKRDTYFPKLALIQINTGHHIYLIDAPAVTLDSFWVTLQSIPLVILHACSEDISIFYLLSGLTSFDNIYDTQIALSFLTTQVQMGYQQALDEILDIQILKEQSQSNWLARPLSTEQKDYAANDVRYLLALYDVINDKLQQQGWQDHVLEDCHVHTQHIFEAQNTSDDKQYLSVSDFRYSRKQLAFLQLLMVWREQLARSTNQPRTFILRKQNVRELAESMPNSKKLLKQKTSIHRKIIDMYGNDILAIVTKTNQLPESSYPEAIIAPYRSKDKVLIKKIDKELDKISKETQLPSSVLLKKKSLAKLMKNVALELGEDALPANLTGWRYQIITLPISQLLIQHQQDLRAGMGLPAKPIS